MRYSQFFLRFGLMVSVLLSLLFSGSSWALSCRKDASSVSQIIALSEQISVSTASTTAGTILWRSPTFTSTFTCTDSDHNPQGENAYLYWDPDSKMQNIHDSLEVGVTYQGTDIKPIKGQKIDIGPGTLCRRNGEQCLSPALSQTLTVTYSIYIKATGNPPPSSGTIIDSNKYAVFQVDGSGGLNIKPDSNFRAWITGLGNISFISCNPEITVSGNNGSVVNFGRIPARNAAVGVIEKQIPFSVRADLTGAGQDCQGQTLMASFSTTYPTLDETTILPTEGSGFGILISRQDSPSTWLKFNSSTELGYINGSVVENTFLASLKWLSATPKIGQFSASANVDITFK